MSVRIPTFVLLVCALSVVTFAQTATIGSPDFATSVSPFDT